MPAAINQRRARFNGGGSKGLRVAGGRVWIQPMPPQARLSHMPAEQASWKPWWSGRSVWKLQFNMTAKVAVASAATRQPRRCPSTRYRAEKKIQPQRGSRMRPASSSAKAGDAPPAISRNREIPIRAQIGRWDQCISRPLGALSARVKRSRHSPEARRSRA